MLPWKGPCRSSDGVLFDLAAFGLMRMGSGQCFDLLSPDRKKKDFLTRLFANTAERWSPDHSLDPDLLCLSLYREQP